MSILNAFPYNLKENETSESMETDKALSSENIKNDINILNENMDVDHAGMWKKKVFFTLKCIDIIHII